MTNPSGSIAIVCGYNSSGIVKPLLVDDNGKITVITELSTIDAADVTYTPSTLSDWTGSADPGNQAPANDQLASRTKILEGLVSDDLLPVRSHWFHGDSFVVAGAAIAATIDATQQFAVYWLQNPGASGDVFTLSAVLKAGAYTLKLVGRTGLVSGQLDIDFKHIDDAGYTSVVANQEWYSNPAVNNVVKTVNFTVVTSGRQIFKFSTNSKNVASGGYNLAFTKISVYLTAGDS